MLIGIHQKRKETLRKYINRFTKVAGEVGGTNDSLKCWIFHKGLLLDYIFREKLRLKEARSPNDMLDKVKPYINYEEELIVEKRDIKFKNPHISFNEDNRMIHSDSHWKAQTTDGPDLASNYNNNQIH